MGHNTSSISTLSSSLHTTLVKVFSNNTKYFKFTVEYHKDIASGDIHNQYLSNVNTWHVPILDIYTQSFSILNAQQFCSLSSHLTENTVCQNYEDQTYEVSVILSSVNQN